MTKVQSTITKLTNAAAGTEWTCTSGDGYRDAYDAHWAVGVQGVGKAERWIRFERTEGDVNAVVVLNVTLLQKNDSWNRKRTFGGVIVEGHTLVNGGSFTRVGFDVSSCELIDDPKERYGEHAYGGLTALLEGEWLRCVKSVERKRTAVPLPGLPFSKQPEWFNESRKTLDAGRTVTLSPHGMGVGYILSRKRGRFDQPADSALKALLGSPLYVSQYDHD